jgi:hypothetical protein
MGHFGSQTTGWTPQGADVYINSLHMFSMLDYITWK